MPMRAIITSAHLRGCRGTVRMTALLGGFCAMLAFSAAPGNAQTKLDVRKLFAEHLRTAHGITFDTTSRVAAVSTRDTDPVPIAGGLAPGVHIFAPGPPGIGQGLDVELNGITNFRGFAALAYLGGTATDSNGNNYLVGSDMRVFQGEYVSGDGSHHRGTFVFI
jgi:hypothetical protein